jgi:hypothetical protein
MLPRPFMNGGERNACGTPVVTRPHILALWRVLMRGRYVLDVEERSSCMLLTVMKRGKVERGEWRE